MCLKKTNKKKKISRKQKITEADKQKKKEYHKT